MADNTILNVGTAGDTIATEDSAGVKAQRIVGRVAHDGVAAGSPVLVGAYAKAAAPTDVSADADAVQLWALRNGSLVINLAAAGALIPGDATNGLDVDVTRLPALVAGTANIGDVDVLTVPADPYGVNADAASATGSISAKLRGISTALGITALDLGTGTGGTRTLRVFLDTASTVALSAGTAAFGKLAANSGVDIGDVDVTTVGTITPGTAATSLGKAIDSVAGATDTGVTALLTRKDTLASLTPADGDYASPRLNARGAQWVEIDTTNGLTPGSAATNLGKAEDAAHNTGDVGVMVLAVQKATPVDLAADGDYVPLQTSGGLQWVRPANVMVTKSTDVTRPADTTAYATDDCWSDSTSSPTSGGFTFTGAARVSGGSGLITDIWFASSAVPATKLQAELLLFDAAVTNVNDNAAFVVSDAEAKTGVGKVPFTLESFGANNSFYHANNLQIGFTCVGTANLRFLIRVKNAYTPVSSEVLTVRLKIVQD